MSVQLCVLHCFGNKGQLRSIITLELLTTNQTSDFILDSTDSFCYSISSNIADDNLHKRFMNDQFS
jgi:hypothetical protein